MATRLPTFTDISPTGGLDLDENCAVKNFLGKSLEEAGALFMENALYYTGDLMWMGEKAFAFYLPALRTYLESPESCEDSDVVNSMLSIVEHRLEWEPSSLVLGRESVLWTLYYFRDHYERFSPHPEIDRNLPTKLNALIERVELLEG